MKLKALNKFLGIIVLGTLIITSSSFSDSLKNRKSDTHLSDVFLRAQAEEFAAINISNSKVNSMEPQIQVDAAGNAFVIWVRTKAPKAIYFNTNQSGQWSHPSEVSEGIIVGASGPWPDFKIDNQGILHIVYTAKECAGGNYEIFYNFYSPCSMASWGNNYNVSETPEGGSANPAIAIDPNNQRIYLVWQDDELMPDRWPLFFRYYNPSSKSWGKKSVLPIPASAYTPQLSVDGLGRLHLIYLRRGGKSSVVYYSRNDNPSNSNAWTEPVAISGGTNIDFAEIRLATDSQGNVYVAWEQRNGSNYDIYFRRCIDGNWTGIVNASQTGSQAKWPGLAVNWTTGDSYLVWQQKKNNKWQVFIKTLIGGVWSSPTDLTNNNHNSIMPSVAVDDFGDIHLAYAEEYSGVYDIMYATTGEIVGQGILPPIGVKLVTKREEAPGFKKNIIRWKKNPDNDNTKVKNYRLYRKEAQQGESQYKPVATLGKSTFIYEDRNLPDTKKFSYVLTTIDADDQESDFSDEVSEPLVFPPVEVKIISKLNPQQTKKINVVSWQENPLNNKGTVSSYRIYRREVKPEAKFQFLKEVSGQTYSYEDKNLSTKIKYVYYLTATDKLGVECEPSLTAFEDPVFPPCSITVVTTVNEAIFFVEKINVLRWKDNPLNDAVSVGEYRIYRRDLSQSSTDYIYIGSVDISKKRFFDRNLVIDNKYSYVLTAVTTEGVESKKSQAVTEDESN